MAIFDLICADGSYHTWVQAKKPPAQVEGSAVLHCLRLSWWLQLPLLGLLCRNHWAKKNGANLHLS